MNHGDLLLLMGDDVHGLVMLEPLDDGAQPLTDHRVRGSREEVASDSQSLDLWQSLDNGGNLGEEIIVKQENLQMFVIIY